MSVEDDCEALRLPLSLLDLLSNIVIFDSILPYLPLSAVFRLSKTSHSFRSLIFYTPSAFRSLDLSKCRGAYVPPNLLTPIDGGGHSWRAERMDENLTEDEFYAGPLRGVLGNLRRMRVLDNVHTLVLDELASVTHDLVADIVLGSNFNVRLLSIRRCLNVNPSKLQQLLRHICRPSRPEGTPRLQGLYVFTQPGSHEWRKPSHPVLSQNVQFPDDGVHLRPVPDDQVSIHRTDDELWYSPVGRVISHGYAQRSSWEETLQVCKGIICFDAVLCTHMHADMAPVLHDAAREFLTQHKPGIPTLASMALGPEGCASCGRAPSEAPVWGESDYHEFPLLWPPPPSGKIVDAVRPPPSRTRPGAGSSRQRLIVSCTWCLANRHCESCQRWWCADCYHPRKSKKLSDLERLSGAGLNYLPSREELSSGGGDHIKVFHGLCVENCLVGEWMAGAGDGGMWG